jgi:hypothetical protein
MSDVSESQASVAGLNRLVASLASADIAVFGIAYDFLHFGSWTVEAGRRHHRVLLQWDGRESTLSVSTASVSDARAQKQWKQVAERRIEVQAAPNEQHFAIASELAVLHAAA